MLTALLGPSSVERAGATTTNYQYYFTKNWGDPWQSELSLWFVGDPTYTTKVASWRSGSGTGTLAQATDECRVNHGWLPSLTYWFTGWSWNWGGGVIQGPVLQLPNVQCWNGTWRTELFVHSTYPWSESHYRSMGCIKVSNTGGPSPASGDILNVVFLYHWYGQPLALTVRS
ncbi:MAG: hypothetical protein M5U14_16175 [Acidimicrobiia bacterium]|nr:hypothetical protein [Acidimicrobiia bacterium]